MRGALRTFLKPLTEKYWSETYRALSVDRKDQKNGLKGLIFQAGHARTVRHLEYRDAQDATISVFDRLNLSL